MRVLALLAVGVWLRIRWRDGEPGETQPWVWAAWVFVPLALFLTIGLVSVLRRLGSPRALLSGLGLAVILTTALVPWEHLNAPPR